MPTASDYFKLGRTKDIPLPTRRTETYGFPWAKMGLGPKDMNHLDIPTKFWEDIAGLKGDDLAPPSLKERIRRNFYGWRDEGEVKAKEAITQAEIDAALKAGGDEAKEYMVRGKPVKPREAIKGRPAKFPERQKLTIQQIELHGDRPAENGEDVTGIRVYLRPVGGEPSGA